MCLALGFTGEMIIMVLSFLLFRDDGDDETRDMDDREIEQVDLTGRGSSARKRKDSYDYMNTVRMLGTY